ncbi:MAG: glycosyltransferase [Candidatus Sumerlaeota bacterium]
MTETKRRILYIRPHDTKRTAIADYSEAFLQALRRLEGYDVVDLLGGGAAVDESIDTRTDRDSALHSAEKAAEPFMVENGRGMIIHAEMGNSLHREVWAFRKVRDMLPEAKGVITVHDPPGLCSNPYRYVDTEYSGTTPIRPFNKILTKTAESWVERQKKKIFKALLLQTDLVLTLSRAGALACQDSPDFEQKRIMNIPMIFADSLLKVNPDELESPGVSNPHPRIALFGFIGPDKGIELLLEAYIQMIERLKTSRSEVQPRLHIFGGIPQNSAGVAYSQQLGAYVDKLPANARIRYEPGFVSSEERDRDLSRAHIQVVPYRPVEGVVFCSGGLVRALGMGRPVIASTAGTTRELVTAGKNGLLVSPDSVKELSQAMERLVLNPHLREELGATARKFMLEKHGEDTIAKRMQKIYDSLI